MEKNTTKKNNRKRSLIRLSVSAMLIGISVVVGALCREYLTFGVFVRITFENLPIILCGGLFGPVYGLCAGLCTDLVSSVATAQDINPIITLGAASVGFVSGAVMAVASKKALLKKTKCIFSCVLAHLIGCILIKTVGLHVYYFSTTSIWYLMGIRAAVYVFIASAEAFLIKKILNNKYIREFSDYEL
jgi:ECF transporter S component (folate family)